jgi:pimeloyl-ACP methyl ester carboxylesterase
VAGAIKAEHRVLIPDLPGHGRSGPADGPLGLTDMLAGVEALLEAEAPGARASLVGNSMGGWLALLYAQRHPGRVARVVIANGAGLRGDGSEARVSLLPRTRGEARAALEAVTSPGSGAVPNSILDDLVRRAPRSPLARIMAVGFAELPLDGKLGEIRAPVTLLWGAEDRILPASYARRMAAQLENARLETIPACGHIPRRECAERLLPLLLPALAEREAS